MPSIRSESDRFVMEEERSVVDDMSAVPEPTVEASAAMSSRKASEAELEAEFRRLCGGEDDTRHLKEQLDRQAKELEELRALRERCARQEQELRELRDKPGQPCAPLAVQMEVDASQRSMPEWLRVACSTAGVEVRDVEKQFSEPWSADNENRFV
ncbi:hypothetical protein Aduo_011838 [Ancylostoma duodenale]